ncbi:hypothetical protein ACO22_06290 [Paracoccidioides brasiliensis]|uniref:Uncharacterized protein n=1 Tax=Paracoccidioides brasiliensis TaxID=121759 RepID=A0A1D2J827_PARBR|nr:hypothetical protein ACO22_06290 [Paracoccidioides brasiliensis]
MQIEIPVVRQAPKFRSKTSTRNITLGKLENFQAIEFPPGSARETDYTGHVCYLVYHKFPGQQFLQSRQKLGLGVLRISPGQKRWTVAFAWIENVESPNAI